MENILCLILEYAQLGHNVSNDTHECYVLSVFLLLLYFQDLNK